MFSHYFRNAEQSKKTTVATVRTRITQKSLNAVSLLLFSRKNHGFSEAARSISARIGLFKSRKSVHRFEQVNQRGNVQYFSQLASDEPLRLDDYMSRQQSVMPPTILRQSIRKKCKSEIIKILEGLPKSCYFMVTTTSMPSKKESHNSEKLNRQRS